MQQLSKSEVVQGDKKSVANLVQMFTKDRKTIASKRLNKLVDYGNIRRQATVGEVDNSDEEDEFFKDMDKGEQGDVSFIINLFESQLKRIKQQRELQEKTGLKAFQATGNPLRDAFRLMLEKKMK